MVSGWVKGCLAELERLFLFKNIISCWKVKAGGNYLRNILSATGPCIWNDWGGHRKSFWGGIWAEVQLESWEKNVLGAGVGAWCVGEWKTEEGSVSLVASVWLWEKLAWMLCSPWLGDLPSQDMFPSLWVSLLRVETRSWFPSLPCSGKQSRDPGPPIQASREPLLWKREDGTGKEASFCKVGWRDEVHFLGPAAVASGWVVSLEPPWCGVGICSPWSCSACVSAHEGPDSLLSVSPEVGWKCSGSSHRPPPPPNLLTRCPHSNKAPGNVREH